MSFSSDSKLIVALSSRALFDFEEENRVFEEQNDSAYMKLQFERLNQPATPGVAYPLVKKLLSFNNAGESLVEVVILSRNDPVSGLRVFKSAEAHRLKLGRGVFTRGRSPYGFLAPLGAHLFLSVNQEDVKSALAAGFPAARVFANSHVATDRHANELRIAFDGDAVLFSDEAERIYRQQGLSRFEAHEHSHAANPLPPGPFKPLLEALHRLQHSARDHSSVRLRTALVTARNAPAHERAIRTLLDWGLAVDEAMFLGGLDKAPFLAEFEPDFFFDDQTRHCESASLVVPTGHVISGIANMDDPDVGVDGKVDD